MRMKILTTFCVGLAFLAVIVAPVPSEGGSVLDLLPKEDEVFSKLPKNPAGDPELEGEAWDILDEKLSSSTSSCVKCHYEEEKYAQMTMDWAQTKHGQNKVDCSRCHGGNSEGATLKEAKGSETKFKKLDPRFKDKIGPMESFNDLAFEYCGQCHGEIYRDWKTGIHGKRTGSWNGEKQYRLCVYCHNPHNPKFPQLKPMPAPWRPEEISTKLKKKPAH